MPGAGGLCAGQRSSHGGGGTAHSRQENAAQPSIISCPAFFRTWHNTYTRHLAPAFAAPLWSVEWPGGPVCLSIRRRHGAEHGNPAGGRRGSRGRVRSGSEPDPAQAGWAQGSESAARRSEKDRQQRPRKPGMRRPHTGLRRRTAGLWAADILLTSSLFEWCNSQLAC